VLLMLNDKKIVAFLPTTDFEKARAFYEGILALRFVHNDGFAMVLEANGTMIRVSKVAPDFKPAVFTILGWEVSGIENVVAMTGKGGVFERFSFFEQDDLGIWTAPSGDKVAWFKDPDGNTLSVSQHA
jgi:catechol 2,3-dioxygenase-like lactoylglutathione lyase family enzyme